MNKWGLTLVKESLRASLTKKFALRSVPRLSASSGQFDTHYARSIFTDVHAAGENVFNRFFACGQKTLRGFYNSHAPPFFCEQGSMFKYN